jgi:hypothetical protein
LLDPAANISHRTQLHIFEDVLMILFKDRQRLKELIDFIVRFEIKDGDKFVESGKLEGALGSVRDRRAASHFYFGKPKFVEVLPGHFGGLLEPNMEEQAFSKSCSLMKR